MPPALSDRHVADDPGRAVAHRDGDAVALGDAARDQRRRRRFVEMRSRSAKVSRSSPATTASIAPLSAQKVSKKAGSVAGKLVTMRAPVLVRADGQRPAGPVTAASIAS